MAQGQPTGGLVLDTRALGRVAAALWLGCGALVAIGGSVLPVGEDVERTSVLLIGLAAVSVGAVVWHLPWHRWGPRSTLTLVPLALAVIAGFNRAVDDPHLAAPFYLVAFAWVGLAHRQGTSLATAPLLVVAYLVPLAGRTDDPRAVAALVYLLPTAVILGEAVAWVSSRLRRAEEARAASEARYAALVGHAGEVAFILDDDGQVIYASPAIERVLGLAPERVLGRDAQKLLHPDDLALARRWFEEARDHAVVNRPLLYRMRHGDGSWRWVEGTVSDLRSEPSVQGIVVNGRDVTERVVAERRLAHVAGHDSLTGLPNRPAFFVELRRALDRATRTGTSVGVLFLDLDGFKVVNDSLGHAVGDDLLVVVADRLKAEVRGGEHLARLGGDEFTLVVEGLGDDHLPLISLAERINRALAHPVEVDGRMHPLSVSIGIAVADPGEDDPAEVLRRADLAMYRAKELGKGRYELFDESLARRARRRLDIDGELRVALAHGDLVLHYQPEIDLLEERVVGMEALVRWNHPVRGLLLPGQFIDVAEDSDLICEVGELVLAEACATATRWLESMGRAAPQVSVNVAARQLAEPGFPAQVDRVLRANRLPARLLRLEILESFLLDAAVPEVLAELKRLGVSLAIDDFGTGYSSLSYLDRLPVDVVKIDRTFLAPITSGDQHAPVVEATIALARSLGLNVVAEGVETEAQVELLRRLGCRRVQGYLVGRPVPEAEATALLSASNPPTVGVI